MELGLRVSMGYPSRPMEGAATPHGGNLAAAATWVTSEMCDPCVCREAIRRMLLPITWSPS